MEFFKSSCVFDISAIEVSILVTFSFVFFTYIKAKTENRVRKEIKKSILKKGDTFKFNFNLGRFILYKLYILLKTNCEKY